MIEKVTFRDAIVEHNDATLTSSVYAADGTLLFALAGYMVLGWYMHDDLFFKNVTRVARYPADCQCYWDEKHYNLYHRHTGLLLSTAMKWINDDVTWERVVQACDVNDKYGLLDMDGKIALPFIYDNVHRYEQSVWPKPYQLFYMGRKECIVLPQGSVFPSEGVAELEVKVEEYIYHNGSRYYDYQNVVILEQHADGKWQWTACQYIYDTLIYEYVTGFVHEIKPDVDIDYGIEYKDVDGLKLWRFPLLSKDITLKLGI